MTLPGAPLDPFEARPFIPAALVGAILDGNSEEGLALNGIKESTSRRCKSLRERFLAGFDRGEHNECWLWKKATHSRAGYGIIKHRRKSLAASRVAYYFAWGPIPKGESVLRRCDNPLCVNPEHLFAGSKKEQSRLASAKIRNRPKGEQNGMARTTRLDVIAMREAHKKGDSITKIARDFNLHHRTVSNIVNYRTWRDIK